MWQRDQLAGFHSSPSQGMECQQLSNEVVAVPLLGLFRIRADKILL